MQPQLLIHIFRLAPWKGLQPSLLPPNATEQGCANVSKDLKPKQTSCSKISQLPFRNKCPAFNFLKPWQGNSLLSPPYQGLRCLIPHSLSEDFFHKIQTLSHSYKKQLRLYIRKETTDVIKYFYIVMSESFICSSRNQKSKYNT